MQHERPHLDRAHGDIETGIADGLGDKSVSLQRHSTPHSPPPAWLVKWEQKRPVWLAESVAEIIGVFFYTFLGVAATAAFFLSRAESLPQFSNLFTVGAAYGAGIAFAIYVTAQTSGGHLSPGYTIAFWLLRGFPARKIPRYIISQVFGGFLACCCVWGLYREPINEIVELLRASGGGDAAIFTPTGPAGIFGLLPTPGLELRYAFANEFLANVVLSILVFAATEPNNIFLSLPIVPIIVGAGYATIIWGLTDLGLSLNTARDLGGRMACAAVFGRKCFTASSSYTAIAALANIPAVIVGGLIQILFLSDSARPILLLPETTPSLYHTPTNLESTEGIRTAQEKRTLPDRRNSTFKGEIPE